MILLFKYLPYSADREYLVIHNWLIFNKFWDENTTIIWGVENSFQLQILKQDVLVIRISVSLFQATRNHITQGNITLNRCFENISQPNSNSCVS
jgi:hypothetical protein